MSQVSHVSYVRVSTDRQGISGLGLEAQQMAVREYLKVSGGVLLAEYIEIESGRRRDRPQLQAALELCRRNRATLVIAKLDRLARNVAFVSSLLESRVRFLAADMPEADVTFLQMASVFAEWETRKISERTKSALAAAKARGTPLGWQIPSRKGGQREASRKGVAALKEQASRFAANTRPIIESIQKSGITSLSAWRWRSTLEASVRSAAVHGIQLLLPGSCATGPLRWKSKWHSFPQSFAAIATTVAEFRSYRSLQIFGGPPQASEPLSGQ